MTEIKPIRRLERGVTLVELMVAMTIMLVITLATVSLFSVTSQSSKTVDAVQELDDKARFTFDVIGQALRLAGYQDYMPVQPEAARLAGKLYPEVCTTPPCPLYGANDARVASVGNASDFGTNNNGGLNDSDTLGVTFMGSSVASDASQPDGTVVDCQGIAQPMLMNAGDLGVSLFWVNTSAAGEPQLACISRGTGTRNSQSLVLGVESFQVKYGIDTDGGTSLTESSVPERWVSAQDVTDWMRVRAVRVGLVIRGPAGSAADTGGDLYPLGQAFTGTSTEAGLKFTAPNDGRLRKAYTAVFMLRNGL